MSGPSTAGPAASFDAAEVPTSASAASATEISGSGSGVCVSAGLDSNSSSILLLESDWGGEGGHCTSLYT